MFASKSELLSKIGTAKRRFRTLTLPVSGATVRLRSLTEGELSGYQRKNLRKDGRGFDPVAMQAANRRLFVLCLVDAEGNRLFGNDDADALSEMDAADASTLYEACAEHCGLDRSDLGEIEKNSEKTAGECLPAA